VTGAWNWIRTISGRREVLESKYESLPMTNGPQPTIEVMKWAILVGLLFHTCLALPQEPPDISAEQHYRRLLENEQVRVYLLTLHSDESALVRLRHGFLTVTLQDGEIIIWDEGKSPIQHFQVHVGEASFRCLGTFCATPQLIEKGVAGGFRNDRPKDYGNITVEFLDPNVGWNMTQGGTIGSLPAMLLGAALVRDVVLQPGDSFPAPDKPNARLVIPISEVDLKCGPGNRIRNSPGEVAWIAVEQRAVLTNAGRDPARFIMIELRPGDHSLAPSSP